MTTPGLTIEHLSNRLQSLLHNVGDPGQCSYCKRAILWVRHRTGAAAPYDPDGVPHFATCKQYQRSRRERAS